jgi:hypothetical protein
MENPKQVKKGQELSEAEKLKLSILAKADQVKGEQLVFTSEGEIQSRNELKELAALGGIGPIDDPQKKYDVYYNGISKLLRQHLPKGRANQKARNLIYEEKNVLLTRGHRKDDSGKRGADGRMGYVEDAEDVFRMVMDWVLRNGSMVDLYNMFRDKNIEKGFGAPKLN